MEEWVNIEGYNGLYEISNLGRIKSFHRNKISGNILKNSKNNRGYYYISLYENGCCNHEAVHKLMLMQFNPIENEDLEVNHINGIKTDNRVENLEWCTKSENLLHAHRTGLKKSTKYWKGKSGKNHNISKAVLQFDLKGNYLNEFESTRQAGIALKFNSYSGISKCCNGYQEYYLGCIWKWK